VSETTCGDYHESESITSHVTEATCYWCLRRHEAATSAREQGPGIVHVRGIEPRPVATVGYDDPTGDDVAADWRRL
jgi:hypothetical protein